MFLLPAPFRAVVLHAPAHEELVLVATELRSYFKQQECTGLEQRATHLYRECGDASWGDAIGGEQHGENAHCKGGDFNQEVASSALHRSQL